MTVLNPDFGGSRTKSESLVYMNIEDTASYFWDQAEIVGNLSTLSVLRIMRVNYKVIYSIIKKESKLTNC